MEVLGQRPPGINRLAFLLAQFTFSLTVSEKAAFSRLDFASIAFFISTMPRAPCVCPPSTVSCVAYNPSLSASLPHEITREQKKTGPAIRAASLVANQSTGSEFQAF